MASEIGWSINFGKPRFKVLPQISRADPPADYFVYQTAKSVLLKGLFWLLPQIRFWYLLFTCFQRGFASLLLKEAQADVFQARYSPVGGKSGDD